MSSMTKAIFFLQCFCALSESERIYYIYIALKERSLTNVSSYHLFALVPGLLHDIPLLLTGKCESCFLKPCMCPIV